MIEPLADIDRPEDLAAAMAALGRDSRTRATVVIPALNEAANLPDTLRSCRAAEVEIIVVDGGSTDRTAESPPKAARACCAPTRRGRSR